MSAVASVQPGIRRTLTRAVALPVAFALLVGAILLAEVLYLLALQRWVERTDRVLEHAYELQKLLVDQETGMRGYLLSGEGAFLEPYAAARGNVGPKTDALEELVSEKPEQVARVRRTRVEHAQWAQFAQEAIALRDAGGDVTAFVRNGRGKRHMDAMRVQLGALIDLQQRLRAQRVAASSRAATAVLATIAGLTVLLVGLLALRTRRLVARVSDEYGQSLATIERQDEALRESEDRFRRLVELSPDGVFVQSGGTIRYANRAMAAMLGLREPAELVGRGVLDIIHPDYHDVVRARIATVVDRKQDVPLLEERFLRADGGEVWVEVAATPFEYDGTPAVQAIVRDVTHRKKVEAARADSEAGLARAQAIAHLGSWEWDVPTNDVRWSRELYHLFGLDPEGPPLRYDQVPAFVHPDDRERLVRTVDGSLERGRDFGIDYRIVRRDGTERHVHAQGQAVRDPAGRVVRLFGTVLDITDRKRAEARLADSEETMRGIVDAAVDAIVTIDERGTIRTVNPATERIFGYLPHELVGQNVTMLMPAAYQPLHLKSFANYLRTGVGRIIGRGAEAEGLRKDGTVFPVELAVSEIRFAGERMFTGTVRDITERKRAEQELKRLNETLEQRVVERTAELREALDDLGAFSYTISHDLRAPLRAMQGFAQALLEDYGERLDEAGTTYARRIVAAAARTDRLAQEVLEYSQLSRRQIVLQRVSVVLVVHEVLGQLERDADFAGAQVDVREPMPWVLAHRATLATVLWNLLANAAKFVAPGVTPIITIGAEDRGAFARVWVSDNGIGIAEAHHERIFNVFERLHGMEQFAGTGIGLAIVRRGVERMGGRAGVESDSGRGSRFWIELPKDPDSP